MTIERTDEVDVRVDQFVVDEQVVVKWQGDGWTIIDRLGQQGFGRFVPARHINDSSEAFRLAAELVGRLRDLKASEQEWRRHQAELDEWFATPAASLPDRAGA